MTIQYFSIIIASVIAIVLGMGWFGPVFGKMWAEIIGAKTPADLTPEENKEMQKKMAPLYVVNIILTIGLMFALYFFVMWSRITSGVTAGFLAWLGFVVPLMGTQALWSGKSKRYAWQMFLLTSGYQLICFVVAGALYTGMN